MRLKLKDIQPGPDDARRAVLWRIIHECKLTVHRIYKAAQGYVLLTNEDLTEKFTERTVKDAFHLKGFDISDPPELKAKRTIVVTGVDGFIHSFPVDDLAQAIQNGNNGIKVNEVIKLPNAS